MFEIKVEMNNNWDDKIQKAAFEKLKQKVSKQIGSLKCTEHGSGAKIIIKGNRASNFITEVSGCCPKFVAEIKEKLK